MFVDINNKEKAQEWFLAFKSHTKIMMPQSKGYGVKENQNGHSPASAKYSYEDGLYISAKNDQELVELLADQSKNPDYDYVVRLV
ncbi:hypothetical protein C1646_758432 [Rhizophagus diaphanus]|nr:hypothetical protein C1646_758432 [Rhizophagus diaphanus] [Rhizophagus sp. MUCL 43196]